MSTGQSAVMFRVKMDTAHFIGGCTCGWQVKLHDPSLTRAIPELLRDEFIIKCYITVLFTLLYNRDTTVGSVCVCFSTECTFFLICTIINFTSEFKNVSVTVGTVEMGMDEKR